MSFQQGLSGLNSSAKQLDTIGNNVANANTVGFKQSQAQFADLYAASLTGSGGGQIGTGSKLAGVLQQFSQGNISNTNNSMDTAISGAGFFKTKTPDNLSTFYSRNGQFQIDKLGFVVNPQGHQVQALQPVTTAGVTKIGSVEGPLQISQIQMPANLTKTVVVGANLDALSPAPANQVFNAADSASYNNSTTLTINDSFGALHTASLYFQRQQLVLPSATVAGSTMTLAAAASLAINNTVTFGVAPAAVTTYTITGVTSPTVYTVTPALAHAPAVPDATNAGSLNWKTYLTIDGTPVTAAVPVAPGATELATLTFDTSGNLISTLPASAPLGAVLAFPIAPSGGGGAQQLTFNFAKTFQYGGGFAVNTLTQDGYAKGDLSGFSTGPDCVVLGRYSNGQTKPLGQLVLENCPNPQGLQPIGNNEWVATTASGAMIPGTPGIGGRGVLQSSAVEDSNVDLTAELVTMITAQRIYQANAQTIKTQDQVLQTLVNLR